MTRAAALLTTALGFAVAAACAPQQQESAGSQPSRAALTEPPGRKAILEALAANLGVKLSVHPSCMGVGTEADDETIGDYVSGFLAEFNGGDARNWIDTASARASSSSGEQVWRSDVMLRHADGDDEWGWGVRFDIRSNDGRVIADSFQCLGAG